jgi:hypothetical protein
VVCSPEKPILGEEFTVHCVVLVNNSWRVPLASASSTLNLPYIPKRISSQNFVGDVSYLSSVSFSGETVRLNLKDVGPFVMFNLSYKSELAPAHHHCSYESEGLITEARCFFVSDCSFDKVLVPIEHPFSGRKMDSTTTYHYDGSRVLVELPCGEHTASFYGPTVEMFPSDGGLIVKNLLNSTAEFTFEIPSDDLYTGVPAVIGAVLEPLEEKKIELPTTFSFEPAGEETTHIEETLQPSELFGYDSYDAGAGDIALKLTYTTFGCVEDNVISEVLENYRLPSLKCIKLKGLEEVKELMVSGANEGAVKKYFQIRKEAHMESFMARSSKYKNESTELLNQVSAMNPLRSYLVAGYAEKARTAYEHGDYITSMYYSRYALLKSTINLGVDLRVILAIAVIAYGLYSSKGKKEEELI